MFSGTKILQQVVTIIPRTFRSWTHVLQLMALPKVLILYAEGCVSEPHGGFFEETSSLLPMDAPKSNNAKELIESLAPRQGQASSAVTRALYNGHACQQACAERTRDLRKVAHQEHTDASERPNVIRRQAPIYSLFACRGPHQKNPRSPLGCDTRAAALGARPRKARCESRSTLPCGSAATERIAFRSA